MRSTALTSLLLPLLGSISALQVPPIFAPFHEALIDDSLFSNETLIPAEHELIRRAGNCPANFNPCTKDGYVGACCTSNAICTTDGARNVACCPQGATCTGTITAGAAASTTGGAVGAVTPTSNSPMTTGSFSILNNPYFPFPVIATTYPNSVACNSAYGVCQTNYAACTANLAGGGFGVTVVAPAGGVTVSPTAQNLGVASATSICSSLSSQACFNLQSTDCAQFGTGAGGSFVVSPSDNHGGARQTPAPAPAVLLLGYMVAAAAGAGAGVGLGVAV